MLLKAVNLSVMSHKSELDVSFLIFLEILEWFKADFQNLLSCDNRSDLGFFQDSPIILYIVVTSSACRSYRSGKSTAFFFTKTSEDTQKVHKKVWV